MVVGMATLLLLTVMWLLGDESNSDLANPLVTGQMTFFALCLVGQPAQVE